jgi:ankyrin repeat protein
MISSSQGHANVVGELLKAGADRTLRNKKHERAIDIATAAGHAEITQLLK